MPRGKGNSLFAPLPAMATTLRNEDKYNVIGMIIGRNWDILVVKTTVDGVLDSRSRS